MATREQVTELLQRTEQEMKELEIAYEQYFLGIEKRAPEMPRQKLSKRIRKLLTSYIPQTDLRYRLQGITSRFNSYCGYWDRIQRLIDEGKYERHTAQLNRQPGLVRKTTESDPEPAVDPVDSLYNELVNAHESCQMKPPKREQVASFLAKQEAAIRDKFGDKKVDFVVVTEAGKPKVKVRAKR